MSNVTSIPEEAKSCQRQALVANFVPAKVPARQRLILSSKSSEYRMSGFLGELAIDTSLALFACLLALHNSSAALMGMPLVPQSQMAIILFLFCPVLILGLQYGDRLCEGSIPKLSQELLKILSAILVATMLVMAFSRVDSTHLDTRVIGLLVVLNGLFLFSGRFVQDRDRRRGKNVVIVGTGRVGVALARHLDENLTLGYRVKGFVDQNIQSGPQRLLGTIDALDVIVQSEFIDEIMVTVAADHALMRRVADIAKRCRATLRLVPESFDGSSGQGPFEYVGAFPTFAVHRERSPRLGLFLKRGFDIAVSLIVLALTSPMLLLLGIIARLDSHGPALYRSLRVGKRGKFFVCYKYRTMVSNADELKDDVRHLNFRTGPTFKIVDDPRITRIGRFFRKFSLDELPQFWNVLMGDMSIVGPRPHPLDDFEKYEASHRRRLSVKPGITGLWQVTARQDPSFETNMRLDVEYIENWSLLLDFKILCKTVPTVFRGLGQ